MASPPVKEEAVRRGIPVFQPEKARHPDAVARIAAEGVGLAATQVGVGKRVVVLDVSPVDETISPMAVVNPEIVSRNGSVIGVEGCLSVPGVQGEVCRAETVEVRGMDEQGNPLRIRAVGILSRALQHEIDHLDGILFIDRLSPSAAASAK